jgi:hypothetical protein
MATERPPEATKRSLLREAPRFLQLLLGEVEPRPSVRASGSARPRSGPGRALASLAAGVGPARGLDRRRAAELGALAQACVVGLRGHSLGGVRAASARLR